MSDEISAGLAYERLEQQREAAVAAEEARRERLWRGILTGLDKRGVENWLADRANRALAEAGTAPLSSVDRERLEADRRAAAERQVLEDLAERSYGFLVASHRVDLCHDTVAAVHSGSMELTSRWMSSVEELADHYRQHSADGCAIQLQPGQLAIKVRSWNDWSEFLSTKYDTYYVAKSRNGVPAGSPPELIEMLGGHAEKRDSWPTGSPATLAWWPAPRPQASTVLMTLENRLWSASTADEAEALLRPNRVDGGFLLWKCPSADGKAASFKELELGPGLTVLGTHTPLPWRVVRPDGSQLMCVRGGRTDEAHDLAPQWLLELAQPTWWERLRGPRSRPTRPARSRPLPRGINF